VPVPTIDGGKLTAGKLVIVPPVVPTIDGRQLGKLVIVPPVVPTGRGQRPGNVSPVVPTIDAGQFQGQADGGQAGHRPGKRRGLPAAVPVPTCRGPRGADDRR
jgi:hypothetical protein